MFAALARFGVPLAALGVSRDDLLRENQVLQVGLPPRRIDVLTSNGGVSFDEAYPDRFTVLVVVWSSMSAVARRPASGRR